MKQVQIDNLQRIVPFDTQMRGNMTQAVQSVFYTVKGVTAPLEVQISLIGPRAMRRLNRESRNIDRETDVLSFPYLNWEGATPGDFTTLAEPPMVNMETGRILMGDIVISMHRAAQQAEEYGHSLLREVCFLAVHGALHLLGYDHITPEDDARMQEIAQKILSTLGIFRD